LTLDKRAFAYYDTEIRDWHAESGSYEILIGGSSRDIVLQAPIVMESTSETPTQIITRNTLMGDLLAWTQTRELALRISQERQALDMMDDNPEMFEAMMAYMPLRGLMNLSNGRYNEQMLAEDIEALNERFRESESNGEGSRSTSKELVSSGRA